RLRPGRVARQGAGDDGGPVVQAGGDRVDAADERPLAAADQAHAELAVERCVDCHGAGSFVAGEGEGRRGAAHPGPAPPTRLPPGGRIATDRATGTTRSLCPPSPTSAGPPGFRRSPPRPATDITRKVCRPGGVSWESVRADDSPGCSRSSPAPVAR